MKRAELKELLRSAIYEGPTKQDNGVKKTSGGEIDELSPATLGSYIKKASKQAVDNAAHAAAPPLKGGIKQHRIDRDLLSKDRKSLPIHGPDGKRSEERKRHDHLSGHNVKRRQVGIAKAADKLARGPVTQPQTPPNPVASTPAPTPPTNVAALTRGKQSPLTQTGGGGKGIAPDGAIHAGFGRYTDASGKTIGYTRKGQWVDAKTDPNAKTQMEMYNKLMEIKARKYKNSDREMVKEMIREIMKSCG